MTRINIGCGGRILPGWVNVDVAAPPNGQAPDIIADLRSIPLPDGCAQEVMAIHVLEHIYEWEAPDALAEWFRLLAPGGRMVLEMPDLMKACRNMAEGWKAKKHPDQLGMWAIYGDGREKNPLMMHKTGWWFDRLKPVAEAAGFVHVQERETEFHAVGRGIRDFRLEAVKPTA
jgi:predicted SAM-dependent methyltransferase